MSLSPEFYETIPLPENMSIVDGLEDAHRLMRDRFAPLAVDRIEENIAYGLEPIMFVPVIGGMHPLGYVFHEMHRRRGNGNRQPYEMIIDRIQFIDIHRQKGRHNQVKVWTLSESGIPPEPGMPEHSIVIDDMGDKLETYTAVQNAFAHCSTELIVPVIKEETERLMSTQLRTVQRIQSVPDRWIRSSCGMNDGRFIEQPVSDEDYRAEARVSALQRYAQYGVAYIDEEGSKSPRDEQLAFFDHIAIPSIKNDREYSELLTDLELAKIMKCSAKEKFDFCQKIMRYQLAHPELYA